MDFNFHIIDFFFFLQSKREREEETYDSVIDYHKQRYNNVVSTTNPAYNPENFLEVPVDTYIKDPYEPVTEQSYNKDNWKSTMSRKYRQDYEDILDSHMALQENTTSEKVRNFYREREDDTAVKTDLRRFHHVI